MGATADCELIGAGFLGQPVNTLTTLALMAAGLVLLPRRRSRWVGIALIATGLGSFAFHGPLAPGGIWIHDVTLAWLILVIAGRSRSWEPWSRIPGLVVLAVVFVIRPDLAEVTTGLIFVAAAVSLIAADRSRSTLLPLALLALAAIVGRLGSTGGPLCDPDSIFQPHGVWHVGSAVAVAWWAIGSERRAARTERPHAVL